MIEIDIPGFGNLRLAHLVMDYNGTLAADGRLLSGVAWLVRELTDRIAVTVVTGDTFGLASAELADLPVQLVVLPPANQAEAKLAYVRNREASAVVAIGNGRNDRLMLREAALGIAVIQREGAAGEALAEADVVLADIRDALALLLNPRRLVATLRS